MPRNHRYNPGLLKALEMDQVYIMPNVSEYYAYQPLPNVEKLGHHGLSCKKSRGRFARHCSLNDAIQRALGSGQVTSVLEPVGLDRGDGKRPDGMTIFPWKYGKALVWDVTVVDTLAQSYVAATSQLSGAAADAAEARKSGKYESLEQQFIVQPIGFETMGS